MWSWEETHTISFCEPWRECFSFPLVCSKSSYPHGVSDFIPYSQPPAGWQSRGYSLFIGEETETNHRSYTQVLSQVPSASHLVSFSFASVAQTFVSMKITWGVFLTHRLMGSIPSSIQYVWSRAWEFVFLTSSHISYWSLELYLGQSLPCACSSSLVAKGFQLDSFLDLTLISSVTLNRVLFQRKITASSFNELVYFPCIVIRFIHLSLLPFHI